MKLYLIILSLVITWMFICTGTHGAEIVTQIVVLYLGTPETNKFMDMTTRFKRCNKTHYTMNSTWVQKLPFSDDTYSQTFVYRQDHGGWHSFFNRNYSRSCSFALSKSGMFNPIIRAFAPSFPRKCPVMPGTYVQSAFVPPRYKNEWLPEMQAIVPQMAPSADKWRVDVKYYDEKGEYLGWFRVELRLLNEFSSQ